MDGTALKYLQDKVYCNTKYHDETPLFIDKIVQAKNDEEALLALLNKEDFTEGGAYGYCDKYTLGMFSEILRKKYDLYVGVEGELKISSTTNRVCYLIGCLSKSLEISSLKFEKKLPVSNRLFNLVDCNFENILVKDLTDFSLTLTRSNVNNIKLVNSKMGSVNFDSTSVQSIKTENSAIISIRASNSKIVFNSEFMSLKNIESHGSSLIEIRGNSMPYWDILSGANIDCKGGLVIDWGKKNVYLSSSDGKFSKFKKRIEEQYAIKQFWTPK